MPHKHVRLYAALAALCISRAIWGQAAEAESVKGELTIHSSTSVRLEVTLNDLQGSHTRISSVVGVDGGFEFHNVPYGDYRLAVVDHEGATIRQDFISIHAQQQPISIDVVVPEKEKPPSGVVSAQELLHPPAKKAFRSLVAAQKFADAGDHERAAKELEKAVSISPDYPEAWVNLGAQHILLKQYDQALVELNHAAAITRPTAMILTDIAFAELHLRRFGDAARSAREAVRLDPSYPPAQYLLGSFLVQDRSTRAEGIEHLEMAAGSMPAAREELERVRRDTAQTVTHP